MVDHKRQHHWIAPQPLPNEATVTQVEDAVVGALNGAPFEEIGNEETLREDHPLTSWIDLSEMTRAVQIRCFCAV